MKLTAGELASVAEVLRLLEKYPPKDEAWDGAQRNGPKLRARLTSWLREQL